jgi:hypothetical protein
MSKADYWKETISIAADECGAKLTPEQLAYIAGAAEASHDNYGLAFYSPPASYHYAGIEREYERKYKALQAEFDRYRVNAEEAVKTALNVRPSDSVVIREYGEVIRYNGRTERIQ